MFPDVPDTSLKHPLFMDKLPDDLEQDETLLAIQNLVYEGTPKEVAENFKDQGNDCFKKGSKFYRHAIEFYTQALKQEFEDDDFRSTLLTNRAAVNLQIENFGRVIEDCVKSIQLVPSVKAYYRLAKATFSLGRYDEAIKYSEDGLLMEENNKTLKKIIKDSFVEKDKLEKKFEEERRKEEEKIQKIELLKTAIYIKGIVVGEPIFTNIRYYLEKSSITIDDDGITHWPVLFVYEEFRVLDFIKDFSEEDTFEMHLERMFPGDGQFPDWDVNQGYVHNNLDIYAIVNHTNPYTESIKKRKRKRKVKLNHTTKLIKLLQHPEYVVPGIPVIYVLRNESKAKSIFLQTPIDEFGNYE